MQLKNRIILLAVLFAALVCLKPVPASAADYSSYDFSVNYSAGYVELSYKYGASSALMYFQVVKSETPSSVKKNAWLPVANKDGRFYIDISAINKSVALSITSKPDATEPDLMVELKAEITSLKASLDCRVDPDQCSNLYDALASVVITDQAKVKHEFYKYNAEYEKQMFKLLDSYALEWKRGVNGVWNSATSSSGPIDDFSFEYEMMRLSNTTIYLRAYAAHIEPRADGNEFYTESVHDSLYSKEAKIKVPKTPAAPVIKIDYAKGSIPIKNGMEFVYEGVTFCVPPYLNQHGGPDKIVARAENPTELIATSKKVCSLTPREIKNAINKYFYDKGYSDGLPVDPSKLVWDDNGIPSNQQKVKAGDEVTLEVRSSGTANKYASWYTKLSFYMPSPAPEESITKYINNIEKQISKVTFSNLPEGLTIEYALVGDNGDVMAAGFKKIKADKLSAGLDFSKDYFKLLTYVTVDGIKNKTEYGRAGIYIRYAAIVDKNDPSKNRFASEIVMVQPSFEETADELSTP